MKNFDGSASHAVSHAARRVPEVFRATLKSLLAHKLRMGMSAFAIVLGVAFVAGTLVFTDTLSSSFTDLFRQTAPDVTVRPAQAAAAASGGFTGADSRTVPAEVVDQLAAVDGVAQGAGRRQRPGHLHRRQATARSSAPAAAGHPGSAATSATPRPRTERRWSPSPPAGRRTGPVSW